MPPLKRIAVFDSKEFKREVYIYLYAVVVGVRDVNIAMTIHTEALRSIKLPWQ